MTDIRVNDPHRQWALDRVKAAGNTPKRCGCWKPECVECAYAHGRMVGQCEAGAYYTMDEVFGRFRAEGELIVKPDDQQNAGDDGAATFRTTLPDGEPQRRSEAAQLGNGSGVTSAGGESGLPHHNQLSDDELRLLIEERAHALYGERIVVGCHDCGLAYGSDGWIECVVANDVWAKISPTGDEGGILCITCIARRLKRLGLTDIAVMLCGTEAIRAANQDEAFDRGWTLTAAPPHREPDR